MQKDAVPLRVLSLSSCELSLRDLTLYEERVKQMHCREDLWVYLICVPHPGQLREL